MKLYFMDDVMEKIVMQELPVGPTASKVAVPFKVLKKKYGLKNSFFNGFSFMSTQLNWYNVATSFCLPEDFIRLYYNELIKYSFGCILVKNNLSIDFIREYKNTFTTEQWGSILHNCWVVAKYLRTKELREQFIREFNEYIEDYSIDCCISKVKKNKRLEYGCVQRYLKKNNIK